MRRRSSRAWIWLRRLAGAATCAGAFAVLPYSLYQESGLDHLFVLRRQVEALQAKNDRLRADNDRIARVVRSLRTDPHAVERAARQELGLVYPGEVVFEVALPGAGQKAAP